MIGAARRSKTSGGPAIGPLLLIVVGWLAIMITMYFLVNNK